MCIQWWQAHMDYSYTHTSTHIPSFVTAAYTELWIFAFVDISQSEQICKWGIKYAHLVMTDHTGSTSVHHYPHTKFCHCSPYKTLDTVFTFLLLANQNRYANEVLNMCIWWWQTTLVVLLPTTTHIPSFVIVAHTELWIFAFFVISQSEQICKWGIKIIKYVHSVTIDHVGTTHIPSFTQMGHCVQGLPLRLMSNLNICASIHADSVTTKNFFTISCFIELHILSHVQEAFHPNTYQYIYTVWVYYYIYHSLHSEHHCNIIATGLPLHFALSIFIINLFN